jgi:hypothetical protein
LIRLEFSNESGAGLRDEVLGMFGLSGCCVEREVKQVTPVTSPSPLTIDPPATVGQVAAPAVEPPKKRQRRAEPATKEEVEQVVATIAAPEVVEPAKAGTPKVDVALLRKECLSAADRLEGNADAVYAILAEYDAKNAAQVPEDKLVECYEKVRNLG